jgi:hypothetical protein
MRNTSQPRIGDPVAVLTTSTYTLLRGPTIKTMRVRIAVVANRSHAGKVVRVRIAGTVRAVDFAREQVRTFPPHLRDAATTLVDQEFDSLEELRDALS